jgi:hypothetical protein
MRQPPNIESYNYCFAAISCDINACRNKAETAMLIEKFDAYGEVLPEAARNNREAAKPASVVLNRLGQYVFWLLVVVIVSARIIYYPATPAFQVGSAADPIHAVTR